ncbi:YicC/YloC family endoribonuclease [uncultured Umboniibacter sp.]|uniref:YicC/YloC family endoribonuclease n=1 Tax=uncultured Umboniibacter sp. TaxID=1798917 RepID=UPI0026330EE0|nr:YicC/YloC family endoribonuclease [uncultured Umboniibacter sp.]
MLSMTAFARANVNTEWGSVTWELKSVNHRYLEPYIRLPESARNLDVMVRERLRSKLARGKVDATLTLQLAETAQTFSLNNELVEKLTQASRAIDPNSPVSTMDVLRWPGVVIETKHEGDELNVAIKQCLDQAISELIDNRKREGAAISGMIDERIKGMRIEVEKVTEVMPVLLQKQRDRLTERLAELQDTLDPERIEAEFVMMAHKADVEEEIDRLVAHLDEVTRVCTQKGAIGRRLDFLMQELNREANTLSSKSISPQTTQSAVEMKVLIEQMREQIQNIE